MKWNLLVMKRNFLKFEAEKLEGPQIIYSIHITITTITDVANVYNNQITSWLNNYYQFKHYSIFGHASVPTFKVNTQFMSDIVNTPPYMQELGWTRPSQGNSGGWSTYRGIDILTLTNQLSQLHHVALEACLH